MFASVVRVPSILLLLSAALSAHGATIGAGQARSTGSTQGYPNKPIRMIVPFSPGGTNDILGRIVATHLSQTLGQPVIVDNRTGADGTIGTDIAAKAKPDGHTLIVISAAYVMNPSIRKLPYDPIKALEFVAKIGASFSIVVVQPSLQLASVNDLLAMAKSKPGQLVIASSGGYMHFASALFITLSKQDFNLVLYKGGAPAMVDVMGGQAHVHLAAAVPALPHLKSGKLKGLAVTTRTRAELVPELPTLDEAGLKGYECSNWYSVATASGTPREIVAKLHEEIARFFTSPEMQKQMTNMGAIVDIKNADEMRKIIPVEIARWAKVAVDSGMPREK